MTAFQRILINTERWNETVVTPSLAKPHELIYTPNIIKLMISIYKNFDTENLYQRESCRGTVCSIRASKTQTQIEANSKRSRKPGGGGH